jgi:hypothetical protein
MQNPYELKELLHTDEFVLFFVVSNYPNGDIIDDPRFLDEHCILLELRDPSDAFYLYFYYFDDIDVYSQFLLAMLNDDIEFVSVKYTHRRELEKYLI